MSARKNIGGVLDLAAYAALYGRDRYQPTDPGADFSAPGGRGNNESGTGSAEFSALMTFEVRRLYGAGHSADFIATQLQLALDEVVNILECATP